MIDLDATEDQLIHIESRLRVIEDILFGLAGHALKDRDFQLSVKSLAEFAERFKELKEEVES